jgi:hypothetical protein
MAKQIVHTDKAPKSLAGYRQGSKLPIRPKGMKISIALIAEA